MSEVTYNFRISCELGIVKFTGYIVIELFLIIWRGGQKLQDCESK